MSPAGPLVPDALLLLLLLGPLATRGDCNIPPEVPNSQPQLEGLSSYPEKTSVTYKCNPGFVKVPGLPDSTLCENGQWSEVAQFCNRSCDVPTRLIFAALQKPYSEQNYFPAGTIVEYECRPGFYRDESLSRKLTCLQNFKWSKAEEFCKRESCPDPGEIKNGDVNITTDILYGSQITFSCNAGYKLVGAEFSYCHLIEGTVRWIYPFPECKEMVCPEPPKIEHGVIQDPQNIYLYNQSVRYKCAKGFALIGKDSIHCAVKDTQLAWSSPHPVCRESTQISKVRRTIQKSMTGNGPGTETQLSPTKPTSSNSSVPKPKPTLHKPTTIDTSAPKPKPSPQKPKPTHQKPKPTHQKPTSSNSSAPKPKPTSHKPTTIGSSAPKPKPSPHKPTTIGSAPKPKPTSPKPTAVNSSTPKPKPTSPKPTVIDSSAPKPKPASPKPTVIDSSAPKPKPASPKPTVIDSSAPKTPLTSPKPTAIDSSAPKTPLTSSKPTSIDSSVPKGPLTSSKPTALDSSAPKTPPTTSKPTGILSSAPKTPLTSLTPAAVNSSPKVPLTSPKPIAVNDLATTVKKTSSLLNTLSTEIPAAGQTPVMANSSASHTTATAQRFTTTKASLTQSLPATLKSTAAHTLVTQGLRTTQRLTSAHVTATQRPAPPRATTRMQATSTAPARGPPFSRANIITFGCVAGIVIIGVLILVKIFWDCGKSGSYYTHENSKTLNATFDSFLVNGDDSEARPSGKPKKDTNV